MYLSIHPAVYLAVLLAVYLAAGHRRRRHLPGAPTGHGQATIAVGGRLRRWTANHARIWLK